MKFILGLIISVIGLYLAFQKVDLPALGTALRQVKYGWLFIAAFLLIFSVWVRALRW